VERIYLDCLARQERTVKVSEKRKDPRLPLSPHTLTHQFSTSSTCIEAKQASKVEGSDVPCSIRSICMTMVRIVLALSRITKTARRLSPHSAKQSNPLQSN
jgi:hypothetical protein